MRKLIIFLLFALHVIPAQAFQADTLSVETFLEWLQRYHPVASQADITLEMGAMELRTARGGFDPMLFGNLDNKEFKESTYYDKREAGLSIPTWAGVELNGTFEQNSGQFLSDESRVPSGGLFAAGASVNLGQGLILDERRAALRQAQIYQQSTEVERIRLLNELYLNGFESYWNWSLAYQNLQVLEEGVKLAEVRFNAIKRSFEQGDFAAIDTVEAYSQLLNRQYRLQTAQNDYFSATQLLNTFLWNEEEVPMALNPEVIPQELDGEAIGLINEEELRTLVTNHPELRLTDFELAGLEVDRKLKAQSILPVVKVKYNFLVEQLNQFETAPFFENNYKWGVSVYTPLLWRKARGSVGLAKAKIDFKQNTRELKEIQLRTKLETEINNFRILDQQVATFGQNVVNLERLLSAELRRFEMGESSLFLINAREITVFDSRLTLNQLLAKQKVALAKVRYAAGLGFE
ncbi:TolC family protein [Algoriphagus hitonicola]|uniref:Outer membrane protein TolC n=1 Tax=Algoriphagus hitonicola TaxID=435880 RepID=A0A1I2R9B6_9BACT|nr:TolC family protein [Algoriphagus hitonicola]SFG37060.1 Outer membrane protein TolC [Algoriphagus hitonicola]